MAETETNFRPPVGFYFSVSFTDSGGEKFSSFSEVQGLSVKINTEVVADGGENGFKYRLPTGATYENLVLKRGLKVESSLIAWFNKAIQEFTFEPKTVTVRLLAVDSKPTGDKALAVWDFLQAYPIGWNIGGLKSTDNNVVVESLELAYTKFVRKK
jgi:phage tail-like protein